MFTIFEVYGFLQASSKKIMYAYPVYLSEPWIVKSPWRTGSLFLCPK